MDSGVLFSMGLVVSPGWEAGGNSSRWSEADTQKEKIEATIARIFHAEDFESSFLHYLDSLERKGIRIPTQIIFSLNDWFYLSGYHRAEVKVSYLTLSRASEESHDRQRGIAAATLVAFFDVHKQRDSLEKYLSVMEDVLDRNDDVWLHIVYHSTKANLADLNGDYFQAALQYHTAISLVEPDNHDHLATMYLNMNYVERALEYIWISVGFKGYEQLSTNDLNSLGVILMRSGHFSLSEQVFQRMIQEATVDRSDVRLAMAYGNMGNLMKRQKNLSLLWLIMRLLMPFAKLYP